jgi:hypothetical protein
MGDWLRDHLDPKLRQTGGRAVVLESADAVPVGHAMQGVAGRAGGGEGS